MVADTLLALGLRNGIGFPQLIAHPDGRILMIEIAARIPGGQMADLVRHAVGVDLVEVALRFALGEPVPTSSARRSSAGPSRFASSPRSPARCRPASVRLGREPRPRARRARRRAGRQLPRPRRDDPAGAARRRPARLRVARRRHRPRGASSAPSTRRRSSTSRSSRRGGRELLLRPDALPPSCSTRPRPAATAGPSFDREPRPGDLFLRHDVDMSLDAALRDGRARGGARRRPRRTS